MIISKIVPEQFMKRTLLVTIFGILGFCNAIQAQRGIRIGYIDMDYILENVPEYQEASAQLETKVQKWKSEIEIQLQEVEDMKKDLNNERALLTKELVEEREEDIQYKEQEILDYQQKRFGPKGDIVVQKKQLIQPVQDQVFNAVQEIAGAKKYDFVFDKSADVVMLYSAERHDISDQIIRSIKRTEKRQQVRGKKAKKEVEEEEYLSVEEAEVKEEKEEAVAQRQKDREDLIKKRATEREALREQKRKEYEERRVKLIEDRQRRKDSVIEARKKAIEEREAAKKAGQNGSTEE